jgi:hypothetical protein
MHNTYHISLTCLYCYVFGLYSGESSAEREEGGWGGGDMARPAGVRPSKRRSHPFQAETKQHTTRVLLAETWRITRPRPVAASCRRCALGCIEKARERQSKTWRRGRGGATISSFVEKLHHHQLARASPMKQRQRYSYLRDFGTQTKSKLGCLSTRTGLLLSLTECRVSSLLTQTPLRALLPATVSVAYDRGLKRARTDGLMRPDEHHPSSSSPPPPPPHSTAPPPPLLLLMPNPPTPRKTKPQPQLPPTTAGASP